MNIQLHGFSDASERAYAAVVYMRVEYKSGEIQTRFIASKSKVAPIKNKVYQELLGACLLSKLVYNVQETIEDELKVQLQTCYWVDSMSLLCWIRNAKPWTQYIRLRVSEILRVSSRQQWSYCPGTHNPADLPSRGIFTNLSDNQLWWEGSQLLKLHANQWPKPPSNGEIDTEGALKGKLKKEPEVTHAMLTSEACTQPRISKI